MKRACADVTLKDGGRRRYVRVSFVVAELNLLSLFLRWVRRGHNQVYVIL